MMRRGVGCSSINSRLLFKSFPIKQPIITPPSSSSSSLLSFSSFFFCKKIANKLTVTRSQNRNIVIMSGRRDHESSPCLERPRSVVKKVLAKAQHEGDGAIVRRSIGRYQSSPSVYLFIYFLPFLSFFFIFRSWIQLGLSCFGFVIGRSSRTWILFSCWMNSQVLLPSLFFFPLNANELLTCLMVVCWLISFLDFSSFSVSPPAGFPDHPHRG